MRVTSFFVVEQEYSTSVVLQYHMSHRDSDLFTIFVYGYSLQVSNLKKI